MTNLKQTEASCLLESGALYGSRVGLVPSSGPGDPIFAGFKKGAFSLYFGDTPIYHFDLEGRWQRAYVEPTHYLKGLDASVRAIDRVREGANMVLKRRNLSDLEALDADLRIRNVVLGLAVDLAAGRLRRLEPPEGKAQPLSSDDLRKFLARIGSWDSSAWEAHRRQYNAAYGPLPFLPPECQNAVVLQATLGNVGDASFGNGPVSKHSVRSTAEFEEHAQAVARLLGRRLLQTRLAFLAGSDVLGRPPEDVCSYLDIVGRTFSIAPKSRQRSSALEEVTPSLEGIHTFLDDFYHGSPGREALQDFRKRHLVHVSLGVESGDPEVRMRYGKTWEDPALVETVSELKSAGLPLGLLTLVGAGGIDSAVSHVQRTAQLLLGLPLGRGDMVFLLDENEPRDPSASLAGIEPLSGEPWVQQQEKLKEALAPLRQKGIKVLPYSLEKQWA
jgi:hypothetical protein